MNTDTPDDNSLASVPSGAKLTKFIGVDMAGKRGDKSIEIHALIEDATGGIHIFHVKDITVPIPPTNQEKK